MRHVCLPSREPGRSARRSRRSWGVVTREASGNQLYRGGLRFRALRLTPCACSVQSRPLSWGVRPAEGRTWAYHRLHRWPIRIDCSLHRRISGALRTRDPSPGRASHINRGRTSVAHCPGKTFLTPAQQQVQQERTRRWVFRGPDIRTKPRRGVHHPRVSAVAAQDGHESLAGTN
jgi:hypothetical protein